MLFSVSFAFLFILPTYSLTAEKKGTWGERNASQSTVRVTLSEQKMVPKALE